MIDKIIAIAALAMLVGFMLILVGFVPSADLIVVVVVVSVMAAYDFYLMLFKRRNGNGNGDG